MISLICCDKASPRYIHKILITGAVHERLKQLQQHFPSDDPTAGLLVKRHFPDRWKSLVNSLSNFVWRKCISP